MSTNNITIDGRLARDVELRFTSSGKAVANVRIGHTPREKNGAGEYVDGETVWLDASLWGKPAETLTEHAKKGDLVIVSGRMKARSYEANGEKRVVQEIAADTIAVVMSKGTTVMTGSGRVVSTPVVSSDPWANVPAPTEEPAPW